MIDGPGQIGEVERVIQLAIAPAFLLTAIFSALNVLAGRLARLTDRARAIDEGKAKPAPGEPRRLVRRARCAHGAIICCVVAAILICLLIVTSFSFVFLGIQAALLVALLLVAAMASLILALALFLEETRLATGSLPQEREP